ncbi:MAG: response regulator transcription factor [Alphaproteobacteria bacterium]
MRVLLIETQDSVAKSILMMLRGEGSSCDIAMTGEEGMEMADLYRYDIVLLDAHLRDIDGMEVLRQLRRRKQCPPILMLSDVVDVGEKVKALGLGADDFLTKPFGMAELRARVHAIVRRANGYSHSVVRIGRLDVHLSNRSVTVDGNPLHLTGKEFAILETLCLRKGALMTKEVILDQIYGADEGPESNTIDVFMCSLRKKLTRASGGENYIQTEWGRGYALREPTAMALAA